MELEILNSWLELGVLIGIVMIGLVGLFFAWRIPKYREEDVEKKLEKYEYTGENFEVVVRNDFETKAVAVSWVLLFINAIAIMSGVVYYNITFSIFLVGVIFIYSSDRIHIEGSVIRYRRRGVDKITVDVRDVVDMKEEEESVIFKMEDGTIRKIRSDFIGYTYVKREVEERVSRLGKEHKKEE